MSTRAQGSSQPGQLSGRDQLTVDKVTEHVVQRAPGDGERGARGDVGWQARIQDGEPRRQHSTMRLEKEHSNSSADRRQLVTLRVRNPIDQTLSAEAAELVCRLTLA